MAEPIARRLNNAHWQMRPMSFLNHEFVNHFRALKAIASQVRHVKADFVQHVQINRRPACRRLSPKGTSIMDARISMKTLVAALAVFSAVALPSIPAAAQGYENWDRWDGQRRMRPLPPADGSYDEIDEDSDVEAYEPRRPRRFNERRFNERRFNERRFNERRYGDDDEVRERDDAERRYRNRAGNGWGYRREDDRRRYDEPDDEDDDDRRTNSRRDTAREPAAGNADARAVGSDGGEQPSIASIAPPRVAFSGGYVPGSIVIDTGARKLYYVTGPTSAFAYPIGVGREGFSWTGAEKVSRIADWPDWYPPAEMRKRKPELPERMLGGINNPLGAKAIYLGNTLYRIHGTNDPKSIGRAESSGCFRMLNAHVLHLASLVQVGAQVTVAHSLGRAKVASKVTLRPRVTEPVRPARWNARGNDDYYEDYR
ncbi:MAG: L,D-transpeptidase [Hyphomicrobium sp.]